MKDKLCRWLAYHLPKRVVYFATIRLWADVTTGKYATTLPMELTVDEAMRRWEELK